MKSDSLPDPAPSHKRKFVAIILVVLVAAAVIAAFVVPVSHSFSYELHSVPQGPLSAVFDPPSGSPVTGSWSCDAADCGISIVGSNAQYPVFSANASGNFSFVASNPPYSIELATTSTSATLSVTGTYMCPLLPDTNYRY